MTFTCSLSTNRLNLRVDWSFDMQRPDQKPEPFDIDQPARDRRADELICVEILSPIFTEKAVVYLELDLSSFLQPFSKRKILEFSNLKKFTYNNVESDENGRKLLQKDRKHCGKRNCSLRAISPLPTVFSKHLCCRRVKTMAWKKERKCW